MTVSDQKQFLRKALKDKRLRLKANEVRQYSEKILNTLSKSVDWTTIKKVHTYLTIVKNNEIDTLPLIEFIRQNHPDIEIEIAPKQADSNMPAGNHYDLIIVPLLGFDRAGNRLGYGGGYYDKFLAANDCKQIIGLAYSLSEIDQVPVEPHDQKMQTIVTEKETIKIN